MKIPAEFSTLQGMSQHLDPKKVTVSKIGPLGGRSFTISFDKGQKHYEFKLNDVIKQLDTLVKKEKTLDIAKKTQIKEILDNIRSIDRHGADSVAMTDKLTQFLTKLRSLLGNIGFGRKEKMGHLEEKAKFSPEELKTRIKTTEEEITKGEKRLQKLQEEPSTQFEELEELAKQIPTQGKLAEKVAEKSFKSSKVFTDNKKSIENLFENSGKVVEILSTLQEEIDAQSLKANLAAVTKKFQHKDKKLHLEADETFNKALVVHLSIANPKEFATYLNNLEIKETKGPVFTLKEKPKA